MRKRKTTVVRVVGSLSLVLRTDQAVYRRENNKEVVNCLTRNGLFFGILRWSGTKKNYRTRTILQDYTNLKKRTNI